MSSWGFAGSGALAFCGFDMPKFWIYTQALIVVFVVLGIVIAIVRLA